MVEGASVPAVFMPKFLKDLGLEKPSWLPDFGGKKELGSLATTAGEMNLADAGKCLVFWYPAADTPG
jgi:hypothetical protein